MASHPHYARTSAVPDILLAVSVALAIGSAEYAHGFAESWSMMPSAPGRDAIDLLHELVVSGHMESHEVERNDARVMLDVLSDLLQRAWLCRRILSCEHSEADLFQVRIDFRHGEDVVDAYLQAFGGGRSHV